MALFLRLTHPHNNRLGGAEGEWHADAAVGALFESKWMPKIVCISIYIYVCVCVSVCLSLSVCVGVCGVCV